MTWPKPTAGRTWSVCRAGALTVSELSCCRRGAILVPFPAAVDDHQTNNAQVLVTAEVRRS